MRAIQEFIFKLSLFFSFFISFAIINIQTSNWGLQFSWVLWLLFCVTYFYSTMANRNKYYLFFQHRFLLIFFLFILIFSITILDWCAIGLQILEPHDSDGLKRSLGHTGYLLFYFVIFICTYHFLNCRRHYYWQYFKWFFIYPFLFISIWGIYQNIATYGVFPYTEIFNNNLSTGFTYLRFKDDHRVSSIFPEPSEYSYYLALISPIIWAYFRKKFPIYGKSMAKILLILLLTQIVMIKSLSFFIALPFIALAIVRDVEGKKGKRVVIKILAICLILIIISGVGFANRISQTVSGDDGSVTARYLGLIESIDVFQRSPFTGLGYGVIRSLDGLSFLLASIGVVGTIIFIYLIRRFIKKLDSDGATIMSGALMCLIASCITSNNTLDHVFIWVLLAFMASYQNAPSSGILMTVSRPEV